MLQAVNNRTSDECHTNPDKECKDVGLQEEINENGGLMIHSCDWLLAGRKNKTISWKVLNVKGNMDCHLLTLTSATSL